MTIYTSDETRPRRQTNDLPDRITKLSGHRSTGRAFVAVECVVARLRYAQDLACLVAVWSAAISDPRISVSRRLRRTGWLSCIACVGPAVPGGVPPLDSGHVVISYAEFSQRASSRVDNVLVDLFEPHEPVARSHRRGTRPNVGEGDVSHHISIYQRLVAHLSDNQDEHDGDIDGGEAKGCGPFG